MSAYETGRAADVDVDHVQTREDLVRLLESMQADYARTGKDEWENATLERYLDGLTALTDALPALYDNRGEHLPEQPTWGLIAMLLVGATGYE